MPDCWHATEQTLGIFTINNEVLLKDFKQKVRPIFFERSFWRHRRDTDGKRRDNRGISRPWPRSFDVLTLNTPFPGPATRELKRYGGRRDIEENQARRLGLNV